MNEYSRGLAEAWLQIIAIFFVLFLLGKFLSGIGFVDWMDGNQDPNRDCFQTGHYAANVGDC